MLASSVRRGTWRVAWCSSGHAAPNGAWYSECRRPINMALLTELWGSAFDFITAIVARQSRPPIFPLTHSPNFLPAFPLTHSLTHLLTHRLPRLPHLFHPPLVNSSGEIFRKLNFDPQTVGFHRLERRAIVAVAFASVP